MLALLTASLGLSLAAAAAPPSPVTILDVDVAAQMFGLGGQVSKALLDEAKTQKRASIGPEEVKGKLDKKAYQALVKCGADTACVATFVSSLGVSKLVVTGQLARDERNYLLKLWLHDVQNLTVVAEVDRAILIASRRFKRDVEQLAGPLLRGEKDPTGTLVLTSKVKGEVYLNGEPAGPTPFSRKLTPGKYEIRVERHKYLPVVRLFDVFADQTTTEEIRLLLRPGETADPEPSATAAAPAAATHVEHGHPFSPSIPTWLAGGTAIVAGAVGLGFGLKARGEEKVLLQGYDMTANTYTGTRAQAQQMRTDATIANVAFGVAGAAAIATTVLVVLDVLDTQDGAPQVAPQAGGGGFGLVVGGTF